MVFDTLTTILERVRYEVGRARRLGPTLARFGIATLEDKLKRMQLWRAACDHVAQAPPRRKAAPRRRRAKANKP